MRSSKILYHFTLLTAVCLLVAGVSMELFSFKGYGWFFSKNGELHEGMLDGYGTMILGIITLIFALVHKKMLNQKKINRERQLSIEKNEEKLSKNHNIYKIRKLNKKQAKKH